MNEDDRPGWGLRVWAVLLAVLLVAPTLVVIPLSFTEARSFAFPPHSLSLGWYENIWTDQRWRISLITSVQIGLIVMAVSTVLGTAAGLALHRRRGILVTVVTGILLAPMIIPNIVSAVSIYGVFLDWKLDGTPLGFILAHTVLALPFVVVPVSASLRGVDPTQARAAATMGAGPLRVFGYVTLPAILPGVAAGALFAFVTSFDEVVAASFLQSPTLRTLPVEMFVSLTNQVDPTIAAVSSVVIAITSAFVLIPILGRGRAAKRTGSR